MVLYSEQKDGRRTIYTANVVNDNGEIISQRIVTFPLYQVDQDGFTYFILYDDNMVPVREAYEYLNFALRGSPFNTRRKTANALRLLYCFLSLSQHVITEIDEKVFGEFVYFIRGIDANPRGYSFITQRSNSTVNGYFAVYRAFFKHIGVESSPLYSSHNVFTNSAFGAGDTKIARIKYDKNLRTALYTDSYVPKYISPDEFRAIYKAAQTAGDKQAEIILHLMYGYGMRLGEVLGLTIEDIDEIEINETLVPILWLRNRLSDQIFQYAKGLPHVIDKKQYSSKDYKSMTSRITLTYEFYGELLAFVEKSREEIEANRSTKKDMAAADIVTNNHDFDENYYIFLNRYGKVLSDQVWNNKLRKYFSQCGLLLDERIRENNLSHRFRHGFAMFHARFSSHPVDALALQKLMRHKSLSSTMVYYNPTPEDEHQIKTEFQNELYEMLTALSKGANNE